MLHLSVLSVSVLPVLIFSNLYLWKESLNLGFDIPMAVDIKIAVFWCLPMCRW